MKSKEIKSDKKLHKEIIKGVITLRDTVTCTMGANGANVIIEPDNGGFHRATKDGVSVADSVNMPIGFQNMGVSMIIDAAISTVNRIGDGTTTTSLLASNLYLSCFSRYGKRIVPINQFNNSISKELEVIRESLLEVRKTKIYKGLLEAIATLSANNDGKIGKLVANVYDKVGADSVVKVIMGEGSETTYKIEDGFAINSGYMHKTFTLGKNEISQENVPVIVTNHKLESLASLKSLIGTTEEKFVLIFAPDFSDEFLSSCVSTLRQNQISFFPVMIPREDGIIDDIAALAQCEVIDKIKHPELNKVNDVCHIGLIKKVNIDSRRTIFQELDDFKIIEHIADLEILKDKMETKTAKDRVSKRIAKLQGKIATISVGGDTETEKGHSYDRFDDSIKATENCIKSGYVLGGGVTYLLLARELDKKIPDNYLSDILKTPFEKLFRNSEFDKIGIMKYPLIGSMLGKFHINKTIKSIEKSDFKKGINLFANDIEMIDLKENGIVEPYDLVLSCIENAVSVAKLLVSSRAGIAIANNSDEK